MTKGVKDVCVAIYMDITGKGEVEAREWLKLIQVDRFATDVFT